MVYNLGEGNGNPLLEYSRLENPRDGGAWWAAVGSHRAGHDWNDLAVAAAAAADYNQVIPHSSVGKESACDAWDLGSIPGLGRSPGEGKGYPLQYSGLENAMDGILHGVAKSWTRLSLSDYSLSFTGGTGGKVPISKTQRDGGSTHEWGRSPGGGNGNPFRYSCLEKPRDRGDLRATVHRVAKSQTQLKQLSRHACRL